MDVANVTLMKHAVRDLEKAIKKERTRIENESYESILKVKSSETSIGWMA